MLFFILAMFGLGACCALKVIEDADTDWSGVLQAIVMTLVLTLSCFALAGCSRLLVVPDADGQGITLVRKSGIEAAEDRVWKSYTAGWYGDLGQRPRTVAVTRSQLNEIYSGYKELYPVEGGVIGGLYFKETQTVYYIAGRYKVLKHEYCHHIHNIKNIKLSRADEERACREAAL